MSARFDELNGQVAVVTGAAKGIGHGISERLAAEGMQLVLADLDATSLADLAAKLTQAGSTVRTVTGDLGEIEPVDQLFATAVAEFGTVDLLVNNAADLQRRSVLDEHEALLGLQLASNIAGPYRCSQRAAAVMAESGGGVIVNISSVGGIRAHHRGVPYDMTKGAIDAMTRAMAIDLGRFGIRVNAIGPGMTETYRTGNHLDASARQTVADRIPLRRIGTVGDIAAMVAFLASDDAGYVTGQCLYVDGGITAQLSPPDQNAF